VQTAAATLANRAGERASQYFSQPLHIRLASPAFVAVKSLQLAVIFALAHAFL
jgi:hypothetical protein